MKNDMLVVATCVKIKKLARAALERPFSAKFYTDVSLAKEQVQRELISSALDHESQATQLATIVDSLERASLEKLWIIADAVIRDAARGEYIEVAYFAKYLQDLANIITEYESQIAGLITDSGEITYCPTVTLSESLITQ